ncbi:glycosyltransferase family 4 protein [Mycolicibacterium fortuitum]|nr:glycosyltransferase family 4 protein [Mycolicibacterium fortuitum]
MRIALVAPPYFDIPPKGYGGTEAVVADLADALTARGHVVTLLGAGQSGTTAQRFIPLWESTVPDRLGQPYPEIMHAVKVRRAIERLAETDGIDLVHDHTFAGPLNAAVHRSLGLPTVLTMHGPIDDDLYPYYRELGTDVGLIAISDRQRELAPDLNWVGRVHNALRISDWPFRSDKGDYALFLGRYAPYKGAHLALDAAHAAGVPLVLAGKCDEPAERAYFEEYVRPRLTDKDHVFGQADAVSKRKLLAGARCLLFPVQWEEPFGMVMIEAMACGTPVVALRGGAVPEVVVDCVTGFVCDHPDELADAVAKTHTLDPAACRRHVAAHFAVGQFGSGYERIYRDVLSNAEAAKSTITLRRVVEPDTSERATA